MRESAPESWEQIVFNDVNLGQQNNVEHFKPITQKVKNLVFQNYKWNENGLVGRVLKII